MGNYPNLAEAQIAFRSRMYIKSAREAFERAHMRAYGVPDLPAWPGDGKSQCKTGCRCFWDIVPVEDDAGVVIGWNCTWTMDPPAEHCPDCEENAEKWNPLWVPAS